MQQNENLYRAGERNIGSREVSVRKKFLYFFIFVTALFTIGSFHYCDSMLCWFAMMFSSFSVAVLVFEIRYHFCIMFGFFNLYNFGRLGNLNEVRSKEDGKKDLRRVAQIVLLSLFIAVGYASVMHYIAVRL